ncbi:MAG: BatA domain-containing protein [Anaerolineales bacterium]|nr:BatA domain-containing protein [Anaerolineales bacterium]
MALLTPTFLLLGLLAAPIILLYMLRLRRQERLVSSTMLWQELLRDRQANAPWQKLRRNLLLLLQLLILAALVFALARPFLPTPSLIQGNAIVLLDASASMQATDIEPSRFAAAQTAVSNLITDLPGSSQMTLIHVGHTPTVLLAASNDRSQLRRALQATLPEAGSANWEAAIALANGAAQGFRDAQIFVVSDGGLPPDLPPLPSQPIYIPIGSSGENVAITALASRDAGDAPQLFASVQNVGTLARERLLTIRVNGNLLDSRRLTIPAGGSQSATWTLPADAQTIEASLSPDDGDFLPLDDTAWTVHSIGNRSRTLLVSEGNLFLQQLYTVLPNIELFQATPGSEAVQEPHDLFIFDSAPLPDPLPDADLLIINPQPGNLNGLFTPTAVFSDTIAVRVADSPLLQFVEWRNIHIRQAQAITAPWAQPLIEAEGGPLLLAGEQNGRRIAILTFDLRDSDLPLQIAFPILMANITEWLRPGGAVDAPAGVQPGTPVPLTPGASSSSVRLTKPDGSVWVQPVNSSEVVLFDQTDQPGLYQLERVDSSGSYPAGQFAVNLFAPAESAIAPAAAIQIGQTAVSTPPASNIGQYELWPWLLAVALLVLLVEWWVYHRGACLPKITFR